MWAVNLGRDTDTNGAITAALLGARYGAAAIPARRLESLERRHEPVSLADALVQASWRHASGSG